MANSMCNFFKVCSLSMLTVISATVFSATGISSTVLGTNNSDNTTTYKNEKAIVFETMGGKSTPAFEGSIQVPENRSNPNSRQISVKYVRFPATGEQKGSPIIYLAGGPGGSGINTAKYPNFRFPLFMALREYGDVIALDQRGTGASATAPKCQSNQSLPTTTEITNSEVTNLYRLAAQECVDFWTKQGVDVLGYTTTESAKDLEALRQHFQAEKITLWGISYGSHLALASLKELKGKIDKVIIASAEGLNQTVKLPARTDAYFSRLQQAINTQPLAKQQYPDIKALMRKVHAQLSEKPMLVKIPGKEGNEVEFLFQKGHLQMLASGMIADPQRGVKHLLPLYHSLALRDDSGLKEILKRGYFKKENISFNVMSFAMDIASGVTEKRLQLVNEQAKTALLGTSLNFPMPHLNKVITGLDLGDDFRAYPRSDVPTLLLTGTLDGRTYPKAQKEATQGLSNLTQVTVVNAGHNLFMSSEKVTEVIKQFLADKPLSTNEITIELPNFVKR